VIGGAAGALAGLLFVVVSINLDRIIEEKACRAAQLRPTIIVELLGARRRRRCLERVGAAHRDLALALGHHATP
jgi:hypothetical protein